MSRNHVTAYPLPTLNLLYYFVDNERLTLGLYLYSGIIIVLDHETLMCRCYEDEM